MAKPKSQKTQVGFVKKEAIPKTTSQGSSKNSRIKSKNDKRIKKPYRGQGR